MGVWIRRLITVAVLAYGVWWFRQHTEGHTSHVSQSDSGDAKLSAAYGCVAAADRANNAVVAASNVALRPPVDQGAWANEEGKANSAISTAESECMGASTDVDKRAIDEARAALTLMRQSLQDLSSSTRGQGGALDVSRRQSEIEDHLTSARGR
jgi:hypothetical protein